MTILTEPPDPVSVLSERLHDIIHVFLDDLCRAEETQLLLSAGTGMGVRSVTTVTREAMSFEVTVTPEVPPMTIERIVR